LISEGFGKTLERGNMPIAGNPKKLAQDVALDFSSSTRLLSVNTRSRTW
jgi:hypothetical protein